jgi:hypothetical protein
MIDLRNASITRSVQSVPAVQPTIELPRAILTLTIQLPVGSEPGGYEVMIRKENESAGTVTGKGTAHLENGITKLTVELDTGAVPVGDYDLAWRTADFDWRPHPIRIH